MIQQDRREVPFWLDDPVALDAEIGRAVGVLRDAADREFRASSFDLSKARIVSDRVFGSFHEVATEVDDRLDDHLLPALRQTLSGSFTEESLRREPAEVTGRRFGERAVWMLDPLDGTSEFLAGRIDGCAVLLALLARKADETYGVRAGIVHRLSGGETWFTDSSGHVWIRDDESTCRVSPTAPDVPGPLRCYVREVDRRAPLDRFYRSIGEKTGTEIEIVPTGGAGVGFAELFEDARNGRRGLLCYNVDYTKEWDVAAGDAVLTALGGTVCDLKGHRFSYNRVDPFNRNGFVACVGIDAGDVAGCVEDGVLEETLR